MAKEKELVMDLEQGIKPTSSTDKEPREMILENESESGNVGFRGPRAKPDSFSESAIPGLWSSSLSKEYCCIYRVPSRLRRVNPEAYSPEMLLIGPLQHSKKTQARVLSKTDLRFLDYMNMERHKKKYVKEFANIYGDQTIKEFTRIIKRDEPFIRISYAESTDWINSQEFVEMILLDSVFILTFFIQTGIPIFNRREDILFAEPHLITAILEDLILLENQLPYALLEELFEPFLQLQTKETLRDIVLRVFRFQGKIEEERKFRHFTDLCRRVRVETLGLTREHISRARDEQPKCIRSLHNANKLHSVGVDFATVDVDNDLSLVIDFEAGILKMPCFIVEENTERVIRNLIALEQCHYLSSAYVCNYISFLDFLIETEEDADLLIKKGSVREMVNTLCVGLVDYGSHYYDIAESINKYYRNYYKTRNYYEYRIRRSLATLRGVYFKDLWTGTATVGAIVIVVLTLIGTVASVLQLKQNDNSATKSLPPPPPTSKP